MTVGLHLFAEGHHVGKFTLNIIKQTKDKREKENLDKARNMLKE
jgi:hypothetical protein